MNRFSNRCLFIAAAMLLLIVTACWAGQERSWPAWRKNGLGITQATGLPIVWDTETNIAWSAEIEGQGNSSPIIWDNKLFITTATNDSKTRSILCYDINSGKRLWQKDYTVEKVAPTYKKNGYASSTACTDGQRVYVFFDDPGIVALDFNGHEQWVTSLGPFKTIWGFASSPAVCQGKLIVVCDQDGQSFIGAFDVASGKEIWRTNRDTGRAYSSPYIFEDQGSKQIIVNGETIYAYDFQTGQELWKCISTKDMITPTAISHNGLVYISQGRNGPTVVVDPSGRGDISDTHVQMRMNTGGPYVPCPLFYPALFLPEDNGLYQFVDQNGKVILKDRIKAHFSASPLAGDNKIYWGSEEGDVYVMDVSKVLDEQPSVTILSVNHMGESVLASPAVCGKTCLSVQSITCTAWFLVRKLRLRKEKRLPCLIIWRP